MPTAAVALQERKERKDTAAKLVLAAVSEFNERGFSGTDTNRIARRAGFAPQTFYRWFEDKVEIFIKVYELWQLQEVRILRKLLSENANEERLVQAIVAHHKAYLVFRRSLRQVSLENDEVRAARARSRLKQIEFIRKKQGVHQENRSATQTRDADSNLAATLFQLERLSDALAEGEFRDMGLDEGAGEKTLALLIRRLRVPV